MSDDIFGELHREFAQVAFSRWYPLIEKHTMKTVEVAMSPDEASALLATNTKTASPAQTSTLALLVSRLQTEMESSGLLEPDGKCFVKLGDRSPKDSPIATSVSRLRRLYEDRLAVSPPMSNRHLQALIFAKAQSLAVSSAQEAVDLLTSSDRARDELEMSQLGGDAARTTSIVLRQWVTLDPAFEFRCFVHNGRLVAASQMATMDVTLHLPQVDPHRHFIAASMQAFWDTELAAALEPVTAAGPANRFVIDLYFDMAREKWWVIELNPFSTSSAGHLFNYFRDTDVLNGTLPFEFRLRDRTPADVLTDVPSDWVPMLEASPDVYGVTEDEWFTRAVSAVAPSSATPPTAFLIVAAGSPLSIPDLNREETLASCRAVFDWLTGSESIPPSAITVLTARPEDGVHFGGARLVGLSSPGEFVENLTALRLAGPTCVFLFGHGGHDAEPEYRMDAVKRGVSCFFKPHVRHEPTGTDRWWLEFPNPSSSLEQSYGTTDLTGLDVSWTFGADNRDGTLHALHWQGLRTAVVTASGTNRLVMILGACYSGGMVGQWLPQLPPLDDDWPSSSSGSPAFSDSVSAPNNVYVMTSSDHEIPAGTWFWGAVVRQLAAAAGREDHGGTLGSVFSALRATVVEPKDGEPIDVVSVSHAGDEGMLSVKVNDLLGERRGGGAGAGAGAGAGSGAGDDAIEMEDDGIPSTTPTTATTSTAAAPTTTTTTTTCVVRAENLPFDATEADLRTFFAQCGTVVKVTPGTDDLGRSRGVADIEFSDAAAAQKALELKNHVFQARPLLVKHMPVQNEDRQPPPADKDKDKDKESQVTRVFVRNLPFAATKSELHELFSQCGSIAVLTYPTNNRGEPRGFAFIEFKNAAAVGKALNLDGDVFHGRTLRIDQALSKSSLTTTGTNTETSSSSKFGAGAGAGPSSPHPASPPSPPPSSSTAGPSSLSLRPDLRPLLESGDGSDVALVFGSASFPVHRVVVRQRCPSLAPVVADTTQSTAVVTNDTVSEPDVRSLLELLYAGDAATESWIPSDWQAVLFLAMELGWSEIAAQLVAWREDQTHGSSTGRLFGDEAKAVRVGWAAAGDSAADGCVQLSFEVEGSSLGILNLYRPENVPEAEWLSMSLMARNERVGGNWTRLKQRIAGSATHWMNANLTIEGAGRVWEVSYGGETPGYSMDPEYLFDELYSTRDRGLTLADLTVDSGVQLHVTFPLPPKVSVTALIMGVLVHVDDFLWLSSFPNSVVDSMNLAWTALDVASLFNAVRGGPSRLRAHVTANADVRPTPRVECKHKHVGLRGLDAYHTEGRYGFELRRGYRSLEELEAVTRALLAFFASPSSLKLGRRDVDTAAITRFIMSPSRVLPEQVPTTTASSFRGVRGDQLMTLVQPWVDAMRDIERANKESSALMWDGSLPSPVLPSPEFDDRSRHLVGRRVLFLLCTDWSQFPVSAAHPHRDEVLAVVCAEQAVMVRQLASITGDGSPTDALTQRTLREALSEFAQRLAKLY